MVAVWIGLGAALVAAIVWWAVLSLRRRMRDVSDAVDALSPLRRASANLFGVESRGRGQIRGNGILALTGRDLRFEMYAPRRSIEIPLDAVTEVTTVPSFLGKRTVRPLLAVTWRKTDGTIDRAAWLVRELDEWVETLLSP